MIARKTNYKGEYDHVSIPNKIINADACSVVVVVAVVVVAWLGKREGGGGRRG